MNTRQFAALVLAAVSLLQPSFAGTVRRKRKEFVHIQDRNDDGSKTTTNVQKLKGSRKGGGKNYGRSTRNEGSSSAFARNTHRRDNEEPQEAQQKDLDDMNNEELENYFFFELQAAKSMPDEKTKDPDIVDTPSPTKRPVSAPGTDSPTFQPTESPDGGAPQPTESPDGGGPPQPTESPDGGAPQPTESPNGGDQPTSATCEDLTRGEGLLMMIREVTDESVLEDSSTPQGQAYQWLLNDDPAEVDPCTYDTLKQRYTLAALYYATNGGAWEESFGWLSGSSECAWLGIRCGDGSGVISIDLRKFAFLF